MHTREHIYPLTHIYRQQRIYFVKYTHTYTYVHTYVRTTAFLKYPRVKNKFIRKIKFDTFYVPNMLLNELIIKNASLNTY